MSTGVRHGHGVDKLPYDYLMLTEGWWSAFSPLILPVPVLRGEGLNRSMAQGYPVDP